MFCLDKTKMFMTMYPFILILGSLSSYDGRCNENVTFKYSMLVTLYKTGEVYFHLLVTNGFHAKANNERFTVAGSQNLKYENFTLSSVRLRQILHKKACRTCSTIIFPHSTNQTIDLWRCRCCCHCRCRHRFLNSLLLCKSTILLSNSSQK